MSDIIYDHEEQLEELMRKMSSDGETPMYSFYSPNDEAYFLSHSPITVERLKAELDPSKHFLDIIGTAE